MNDLDSERDPQADAPETPDAVENAQPEDAPVDAAPDAPAEENAPNGVDETELRAAVEAILFAAGEPLPATRIARCISGVDGRRVRSLLLELIKEYETQRRGFLLEEVAGGFRLYSRPEYFANVEKLFKQRQGVRLSTAAIETLAIVAYKQPITRADIEDIRGVAVGPMLRNLLDLSLVKIAGRAEILGRPLLYGTTKKFLEHFGLKSLADLPKIEDFQSAMAEKADAPMPPEDIGAVALQTAIETADISPDGVELSATDEEEEPE